MNYELILTSLNISRSLAVSNLCFIETKRLTIFGLAIGAGKGPSSVSISLALERHDFLV